MHFVTHEHPDLLVMVHSALAALPRSISTSSSQDSVSSMLLGFDDTKEEEGREREGRGSGKKQWQTVLLCSPFSLLLSNPLVPPLFFPFLPPLSPSLLPLCSSLKIVYR